MNLFMHTWQLLIFVPSPKNMSKSPNYGHTFYRLNTICFKKTTFENIWIMSVCFLKRMSTNYFSESIDDKMSLISSQ